MIFQGAEIIYSLRRGFLIAGTGSENCDFNFLIEEEKRWRITHLLEYIFGKLIILSM